MMSYTIDDVMSWKPCYSREQVSGWFGARTCMTVDDLMELDISDDDKLWCLLRPHVISERKLHELACNYADHALQRERAAGHEPDRRSWAAIETKRRWLRGEATDQELAAAWSAARAAEAAAEAAAWVAARVAEAAARAAGAAAWAAAWTAEAAAEAAEASAWMAAGASARSAARASARSAEASARSAEASAWAAAREAERQWQLTQAAEAVKGEQDDLPTSDQETAGRVGIRG